MTLIVGELESRCQAGHLSNYLFIVYVCDDIRGLVWGFFRPALAVPNPGVLVYAKDADQIIYTPLLKMKPP